MKCFQKTFDISCDLYFNFRCLFFIFENGEVDVLFKYQYVILKWLMGDVILHDVNAHFIQQFATGIFTHVKFEILAYSRQQINKQHIGDMILNENSFMLILMSVFVTGLLFRDQEDTFKKYVHRIWSCVKKVCRRFQICSKYKNDII